MFDRGDAVSQWPETQKGVVVGYHWDEHTDEPMYQIKWLDGKITTEYANTLNHYCNPDVDTEDLKEKKDECERKNVNEIELINQISDARTREGE